MPDLLRENEVLDVLEDLDALGAVVNRLIKKLEKPKAAVDAGHVKAELRRAQTWLDAALGKVT